MRRVLQVGMAIAGSLAACSLLTDSGELVGGQASPLADAQAERTETDTSTPVEDTSTSVDVNVAIDGGSDVDAAQPPTHRDVVLEDDPVIYFPFDDAAGSSFATDLVGGKHAVVAGSVTFASSGVEGTGVKFSGSGYLDVGDTFDLVGNQPYSIEVWARPTANDLSNHNLLIKRWTLAGLDGSTSTDGYMVFWHALDDGGGRAAMQQYGNPAGPSFRFASADFPTGKFVHFVFTYDPSVGFRMYTDAIQTTNFSDSDAGSIDTPVALRIGEGGYAGELDEIALYDHALTAARIRAHYDAIVK